MLADVADVIAVGGGGAGRLHRPRCRGEAPRERWRGKPATNLAGVEHAFSIHLRVLRFVLRSCVLFAFSRSGNTQRSLRTHSAFCRTPRSVEHCVLAFWNTAFRFAFCLQSSSCVPAFWLPSCDQNLRSAPTKATKRAGHQVGILLRPVASLEPMVPAADRHLWRCALRTIPRRYGYDYDCQQVMPHAHQ